MDENKLITEKKLLELGFKKTNLHWYIDGIEIEYEIFEKDGFIYNNFSKLWYFNENFNIKQPKYIYELQSMYFEFTGKELI